MDTPLKKCLFSPGIVDCVRLSPGDFTRQRALPLPQLAGLLLSLYKGTVQDEHDGFWEVLTGEPLAQGVSASALCQARQKLNPLAFLRPSERLVRTFATRFCLRCRHGWRLLAADGSIVRQPNRADSAAIFGSSQNGSAVLPGAVLLRERRVSCGGCDATARREDLPERKRARCPVRSPLGCLIPLTSGTRPLGTTPVLRSTPRCALPARTGLGWLALCPALAEDLRSMLRSPDPAPGRLAYLALTPQLTPAAVRLDFLLPLSECQSVGKHRMVEKRSVPRRKPSAIVKVFDEITGSDLGQVANLTPEGLMLVSRTPVPLGSIFQLGLRVPSSAGRVDQICFGAESVWASQTEDAGGYFWSGFSIIDISGEAANFIEHWIDSWTVDNE